MEAREGVSYWVCSAKHGLSAPALFTGAALLTSAEILDEVSEGPELAENIPRERHS